ncbi:MAG: glutamate racemase [Acidobacteria bacterium]|nr:MAG: glutamate racemase [Acidobacteriota bacterium]
MFDSGVGGLSVAREIRRTLPAEDLLYVADTAYCPYGDRPLEEVRTRALAVGRYLERAGAKLVVAACNTASGAALEQLRQALAVPVVGLEPAVKTGAAVTRNRKLGVMATAGTLASARFARLVRDHAHGVEVVPQPCPGLADLVEEGHFDGERLQAWLEQLTQPLKRAGVDTVVLGCTHYAFVSEPIARVLGPAVQLVDSAPAIARRTEHLLRGDAGRRTNGSGTFTVLTTGDPRAVALVVARLWGAAVPVDTVAV